MPTLHLDHIALPVADAVETHRFYTQVLGLPVIDAHSGDDWGGKPWLMMIFGLGDNRQLALIAFKDGKLPAMTGLPNDSRHFAFAAKSVLDLKAWESKLKAASIAFSEEDHGGRRSLYFSDPNGYTLEITAPASNGGTSASANAAAAVREWAAKFGKAPLR